MARIKSKGPFAGIRELLKYGSYIKFYHYPESGIVEMVVDGRVTIHAQIIEGMEETRYKLETFRPSTDPEYIDNLGDFLNDIEDEDDVPAFTRMKMRFKDLEPPPLENSNTGAQRREPLDAEFEAARRDAALSSCNVNMEGDEDDDIADT
jgi:hypothetical protein